MTDKIETVVDFNVLSAPRERPRDQSLADARAATEVRIRADRLAKAVKALERCGLPGLVGGSGGEAAMRLRAARESVQALRATLADGHDEPRYAATGVALEALGRLWACS